MFLPCFYSLHPSFTLWLPCGCEHTSISCQVCQVSFWRIDRRNNGAGDIMRQIYLKQVPQDSLLQRIEAVRFDKWFRRSTELNMSWSKGSPVCRSLITSNHFSSDSIFSKFYPTLYKFKQIHCTKATNNYTEKPSGGFQTVLILISVQRVPLKRKFPENILWGHNGDYAERVQL